MTRALIVDDKLENRYLLHALLAGHGFEVVEADNGVEALAAAGRQAPDVVVTDLLMPKMDGYALLRAWKADTRLAGIPVIVYTATYTEPKDEKLALDLGADAFIVKPTEPDVFMRRPGVAGAGTGREGDAQALQRGAGKEAGEEERRA